ncbi:MAG: SH3 domain-containing protein [Anaerolineae bacterium]|nr:SH3 domain-containing protein [Anaerolineae bacterium]
MASPTEQQVQFVAPRLVVNASFLNARVGPGVQYAVLITLVGGTELPVLGRASDNVWFQVSTPVGVGWVNVEYTIPRGSFDRVPVISLADIAAQAVLPGTPSTLALPTDLGQGGGGGAPATAGQGGLIQLPYGEFSSLTSVAAGERFRVKLEVEAVNVRTQPNSDAPSIGTIFRDETNVVDYPLVGSSRDKNNVDWFAIDVAGVGTGWIEAPKASLRLSRVSGNVYIVTASVVQMTDSPNGSGNNMPNLTSGREGFLVGASQDGKFAQLELADGLRGWVPLDAITGRAGTVTDQIDLSRVPSGGSASAASSGGSGTGTTAAAAPGSLSLDTPHVVVNTPFLNGRSGPGVQYTAVATFAGGTELPVIGIASDGVWMLVTGPFGQAWINDEFAVFRGSIQAVPVIRNAAGVLSSPTAVIAAPVTIYAAPGTSFGAIGTVPAPAEVAVVARTADFTWVQLNTVLGFGWVPANQVTLRGDTSLIPVVG